MTRKTLWFFALASLFAAPLARAGEEKKAPAAPVRASDEEVATALAQFKEDYKATGLKGDDRISQRDWAMKKISRVQHPSILDAIAQVARGNDGKLRLIAVLYLGDQKLMPGTAGREILGTMQRNKKDLVLMLSGLDSIGLLRYLGAREEIVRLLRGENFVLKKAGVVAAGETRDIRFLPDLLKMLGIEVKGDETQGEVVVQEGYAWEGAEATVDHGHADNTQENAEAERIVNDQIARNQAAAAGAAAAGADSAGGAGGRGGAARSDQELAPHILKALGKMTGQDFTTGKQIAEWMRSNKEWLAAERKRVQEEEKRQATEGKGD